MEHRLPTVRKMNTKALVQATALLITVVFAVPSSAETVDPSPLRPADTSSPRATLRSLIEYVDGGYRGMADLYKSYDNSGRLYLDAKERQKRAENVQNVFKGVQCLDLSDVSPILKNVVALERILQLKEILDRIEVPRFQDIPDREAMAQASSKRWTLPDTEIEIVLIEEGPRAGEYLVSAETVDRLPDFYRRVKDLPYKSGPAKELYDVYRTLSSGRAETIYEAWASLPEGLMRVIPPRWMVSLPSWATNRVAGVTMWQWLGLALELVLGFIFILVVSRLSHRLVSRNQDEPGPGWHRLSTPLATILVAAVLMPAVNASLRIGGSPLVVIAFVLTITLFLSAAWASMIGGNLLGETIVASQPLRRRSMDSQLIRLGARLAGVVVAIGFLIEGSNQLGFPAYSVLAGLGVGGLAVALAARDSLANLLGSVVIMFEKPFRVGHWIKVGETEGTVEDVGFRSTRIRTFYNSLISIPNSEVVNTVVDNLDRRFMRRQRFFVQITYDTPREKVEEFLAGIKQLIVDHPMTVDEKFYARFNGFGESGLNILVNFFLRVPDYVTELEERERILLQILVLAKDVGVEFAFPTRTLHVESRPETAKILSEKEVSDSRQQLT